jgi:hypothetical protein
MNVFVIDLKVKNINFAGFDQGLATCLNNFCHHPHIYGIVLVLLAVLLLQM